MNKIVSRLRRAAEEKMTALREAVIEGNLNHDEYLKACGEHSGLKWLMVELQELTRTASVDDDNENVAEFDDR